MPTARRLMIQKVDDECNCEKPETNAGWWTVPGAVCHGAWAAKGAADFPTSFVDLSGSPKSSVIKFSPVSTSLGRGFGFIENPTWDTVNGWKFDASQGFATTVSYCLHNTVIFRFSDARKTAAIFGTSLKSSGFERNDIKPNGYGHGEGIYAGIRTVVSPGLVQGIVGFAGNRMIVNKLTLPETHIQKNVIAGSINLGHYNLNSGLYIQAFAIYCTKLTKIETDALGDRMLAI